MPKNIIVLGGFWERFFKEKKFLQEKNFATQKLKFFARINFRECYWISYSAVINFSEFGKTIANWRKVSFFKVIWNSYKTKAYRFHIQNYIVNQ